MLNLTVSDIPRIREVMAQAVAERGADFVYNPGGVESCYYTSMLLDRHAPHQTLDADDPRSKTGCLIGEVMRRLGIPVDALARIQGGVSSLAIQLQDRGLAAMDTPVIICLSSAQSTQDNGSTWGAALAEFDKAVERLSH